MRKSKLYIVVFISLILGGCSTGTNLTKTSQEAETAYIAGNYQKALEYFEAVINQYKEEGRAKECPVYYEAAVSALQTGQDNKALGFLEMNRYTPNVNGDTYFELAKMYRKEDNLSKELDALETYQSDYPDGKDIAGVEQRLYDIYVGIDDWEKVIGQWDRIPETSHSDIKNMEGYFKANKAMENDSVCNSLALEMLDVDGKNLPALDWTAKKYFWQAEDLYQAELEAYEKNKTNKQYNQLLKALDVVSADFKTSLGYFTTLYELDPTPKTAKYLGNIYNRLDDKKKADYYYKLAETP
jgi:tetratricopeptide (TPR) repeat protein